MNYDEKLHSDADEYESRGEAAAEWAAEQLEDMRKRFFGDLAKFRAFLACDPTALDGAPARSLLASALYAVSEDACEREPRGHAAILDQFAATSDRFEKMVGDGVREMLLDDYEADACDLYDGGP